MRRLIGKTVTAVVAVAFMVNVGMAYTIPAYAIAKYRTWLNDVYTYLSVNTPFFARPWGTVPGMPMMVLESIPTAVGGGALGDTIKFDRPIACPFVCASEDTLTATVQVFRDYYNNTPAQMVSPSITGDSMWFTFPGEAAGFVVTLASDDTAGNASYWIVGGIALPVPE